MSSGAVHAQLAHEVKAQGQSDLQKLVQELDLNQIRIPQGNFLTMKADLCLREGEKSLHKQGRLIVGDNMIGEKLPFLFNNGMNGDKVVRPSACVDVKSLAAKIFQQLEGYDEYDKLF